MKITRFHHVSVNVSDAELSDMVSFYGDLFGLDSKDRPEIPGVPGHWFRVADQELHVVGAPPRGTPIDSTGNHYCVAVEDLDAAIASFTTTFGFHPSHLCSHPAQPRSYRSIHLSSRTSIASRRVTRSIHSELHPVVRLL